MSENGASALSGVVSKVTPAGSGVTPNGNFSQNSISAPNCAVSGIVGDICNTLSPSTFEGGVVLPAPATGPTTYYLNRWLDVDCDLVIYRTWVTQGTADSTGIHYSGTKCGGSSISNVVVAATWSE